MIFKVHLITLLIVSQILDSIEYFLVLHFNTAWLFLLSNSGTDFMEQIVDTVSGAPRDLYLMHKVMTQFAKDVFSGFLFFFH